MSAAIESERALLGALVLDPDPADVAEVFAELEPDAFSIATHGLLFNAAREVHRDGLVVDEVTVITRLESNGTLQAVGGRAQVLSLTEAAASSRNLGYYLKAVRDQWLRRRYINTANSVVKSLNDDSVPVGESAQRLVREILAFGEQTSRGQIHHGKDLMVELMRKMESDRHSEPGGAATGFADLDHLLCGGLQDGELSILAGRPSMGKTALGLEIAVNAAAAKRTVLFVSLEMSAHSLMMRIASSRGRVGLQTMRKPQGLGAGDWAKISRGMGAVGENFLVVDQDGMTIEDIRAKARTAKAKFGLGLVVVDYLQLVRALPAKRQQTRERDVAEMSAGLKGMAKELQVPVLCLAQLNRALESRDSKRPRLSDLRESGSVEQDADVVMFVHREAYYNSKADETDAEVIIAKQRNGPTGEAKLHWSAKYSSFSEPKGMWP